MNVIEPDSHQTDLLLNRISRGDEKARSELVQRHTPVLRQAVSRRLDARIRPRIDPSDVVQETQLDIMKFLDDYVERRPMPFRLWVLKTAHQRMLKVERHHLRTAMRTVDREMPMPDGSSMALANHLIGRDRAPDQIASRRDTAKRIRQILARLSETDREIILLRVFEGLSNDEVAQLLDVERETAKKRYTRALLSLERRFVSAGLSGGDQ